MIFSNAIENIKNNKLKVFVAIIWIVLGITSVVVVSSMGDAMGQRGNELLGDDEFRTNNVTFYRHYDENTLLTGNFYEPFTEQDMDALALMEGVERVEASFGDSNTGMSLGGFVSSKYEECSVNYSVMKDDQEVVYGRPFSIEDEDRNVIILDYYTAEVLFEDIAESSIGEMVTIGDQTFEVIGVTEDKPATVTISGGQGGEETKEVFIPKKALNAITNVGTSDSTITGLKILLEENADMDKVRETILDYFEDTKNKEKGEYSFTGASEEAWQLSYMNSEISRMTGILSTVALVIGGLGITNIMYMSVAERQREIGIRRSMGASRRDITKLFLLETIIITVLGGVIGVFIGCASAKFVGSHYLNMDLVVNIQIVVKALITSVAVGTVFGTLPAMKAARMDPIKAIQG